MPTPPSPPSPLHIYFLPFPSPTHAIPKLDLAKLLAKRNTHCTLLLTPPMVSRFKSAIHEHNLSLHTLEQPLEQPFRDLIRISPPDAIVADASLPWAAAAAAELHIPHYSFSGAGGCFTLSTMSDPAERSTTDGWIVNTCAALERTGIERFEREMRAPVFAVGPVCISGTTKGDILGRGYGGKGLMVEAERILGWLDGRPASSVAYVRVGGGGSGNGGGGGGGGGGGLSKAQLREIGFGLVDSGMPFVWAVGDGGNNNNSDIDDVTDEVSALAGNSGRIVKGWAPQFAVLLHAAVGTFVTNCGWNSVTEAVVSGCLMLTWPISKQQVCNERFVVALARIGVRMKVGGETEADSGALFGRERVAERVRWAHSAESEEVRKRAWDLGLRARMEFLKGGSSFASADCLIDHIRCKKGKIMEPSNQTV